MTGCSHGYLCKHDRYDIYNIIYTISQTYNTNNKDKDIDKNMNFSQKDLDLG